MTDVSRAVLQGKVRKPRSSRFTHTVDPDSTMAVSERTVTLTLREEAEAEPDTLESGATVVSTTQNAVSTPPRYQTRDGKPFAETEFFVALSGVQTFWWQMLHGGKLMRS